MNHSLANAELAVMDLLWRKDDKMTAREIREALYPDEKKAQHGTVQRLLQRLEEKGFIERDRNISVHFFKAIVSRDSYAGGQLESLADRLTSGSFAPLITHLVEQRKISRNEIEKIRSILDAHDNDMAGAGDKADCRPGKKAGKVGKKKSGTRKKRGRS